MTATFCPSNATERTLSVERMEREIKRITPNEDGCWFHENKPIKTNGYVFIATSKNGPKVAVHRLVYRYFYGDVPEGMVIDHTCHTEAIAHGLCNGGPCKHRACCNPQHLRAVSFAVNLNAAINKNRPFCPRGHEKTPENRRQTSSGNWECAVCRREWNQEYRMRKMVKAGAA